VVLTVWEPVATWEPYDPATILSARVSKLLSRALGVDKIAAEVAEEKVKQGVALASSAGFAAQGRVAHGKTWRAICDVAGEIDARAIVLGARGLSQMESLLLGSVSTAVLAHAKRPVLVVPHHGGG
jgi:nucleotide-binding universal stress UspA family protein